MIYKKQNHKRSTHFLSGGLGFCWALGDQGYMDLQYMHAS